MTDNGKKLYEECFETSEHQLEIRLSHLPFQNGYYITEYGTILMVRKPNIYRLEKDGWNPAQGYFKLWYDSLDSFADIPPAIVKRLKLDEYEIQPCK